MSWKVVPRRRWKSPEPGQLKEGSHSWWRLLQPREFWWQSPLKFGKSNFCERPLYGMQLGVAGDFSGGRISAIQLVKRCFSNQISHPLQPEWIVAIAKSFSDLLIHVFKQLRNRTDNKSVLQGWFGRVCVRQYSLMPSILSSKNSFLLTVFEKSKTKSKFKYNPDYAEFCRIFGFRNRIINIFSSTEISFQMMYISFVSIFRKTRLF